MLLKLVSKPLSQRGVGREKVGEQLIVTNGPITNVCVRMCVRIMCVCKPGYRRAKSISRWAGTYSNALLLITYMYSTRVW